MNNFNTRPSGPPYDQPDNQAQAKENLKYYRIRAGITQTNLATALNLKAAAVNRWESPRVDAFIPFEKVQEVAKHLHIDPKALRIYRPDIEALYESGLDMVKDPYLATPVVFNKDPKTLADYKNNLKYLRLKRGLTQKDLGNALGLSHSIASTWENPDNTILPTSEYIERLGVFYSVDTRLIAPSKSASYTRVQDRSSTAVLTAAKTQGHIDRDANRIYDRKSNVSLISMIQPNDNILNMTTRACAGAGPEFPTELQFDASVAELLGIRYCKGLAAAKVIGDSMFNPDTGMGIPSGAIVLIDTTKNDINAALGKVVCFCVDGCYLIKRLRSNNGVLNAVSDNPNYFPLFYDNIDNIKLIGEVVSVLLSVE